MQINNCVASHLINIGQYNIQKKNIGQYMSQVESSSFG
jgi:hypothetical protein